MKLLKALILVCLLGGDRGPDPASLEAFPLAARGCDGRANIYVCQLPTLSFSIVDTFLLKVHYWQEFYLR